MRQVETEYVSCIDTCDRVRLCGTRVKILTTAVHDRNCSGGLSINRYCLMIYTDLPCSYLWHSESCHYAIANAGPEVSCPGLVWSEVERPLLQELIAHWFLAELVNQDVHCLLMERWCGSLVTTNVMLAWNMTTW